VDFEFEDEPLRGIEQNPDTASRWAALARGGQKVMQFTSGGRFFANVAQGKINFYQTRLQREEDRALTEPGLPPEIPATRGASSRANSPGSRGSCSVPLACGNPCR
jgi:hypothetical protein